MLTQDDLKTLVTDIHQELDTEIRCQDTELREMAKYYFDGQGKAIRPVIALSLVHDDVVDHAETRRGKVSVNVR